MLHFVIGCAVTVGVWYQFILPERQAKAQRELVMWTLDGFGWHEACAKGPAAFDRRMNRLRRRAGFPPMPVAVQPPTIIGHLALEPFYKDSAVRFAGVLGLLAVIGLCVL